jgi:hypothetical protein
MRVAGKPSVQGFSLGGNWNSLLSFSGTLGEKHENFLLRIRGFVVRRMCEH